MNIKSDKNGLPVKEYYKEGNIPTEDKIKAVGNQKYYTAASIIFMILVLIGMYFVLN